MTRRNTGGQELEPLEYVDRVGQRRGDMVPVQPVQAEFVTRRDIVWALRQLDAGRCVRRRGWPQFQYVTTTRRGCLEVHGDADQELKPVLSDCLATDWEHYDGQRGRFNKEPARPGQGAKW